ncbi:MAG: TonB-dependent receptor [Thiobacillus sp.]|nr:TonB-dependent receptor [Thiobacillus sp.]
MSGALAFAGGARAETTESNFLDDLPVVLSASRLSQPLNEAPAAVTVIDQDMIRASGFRDIPDLLRLVPGFSVAYTRDNTWAAGYHGLGDAYSRRFQVLIDGRSIYSPHYGAVYWADLPLAIEDIERIEVIRGPNAAIHGANAFAAVINIITKTAAQAAGTLLSAQLGEQDMRGLLARHGGGDSLLRYRLTVSAQQRDRFERDVDYKPPVSNDNGRYFEASKTYFANGRADWQLAPDSSLSGQFGVSHGDWAAGRDNGLPSLEPRHQDSRAFYLQLAWHRVESARREWRVQAYHTRNRFDADRLVDVGAGVGYVGVDQYLLQTRSNIELQVNEQWRPDLRVVWGAEARRETVKSPQNYGSAKTLDGDMMRVFGNLEWRPRHDLLLQGGAMLEHHYFTATDVSPRIAANYTLKPGQTIRIGVSRAYRSPTFFEQEGNEVIRLQSGALYDAVTVPSDGLKPERVLSREIGYIGQWPEARLDIDLRLFRDHIDDFIGQLRDNYATPDFLIGGVPYRPNEFKSANIGTVDSQGGELQLRWRPLRNLDIHAHYARVFVTADTVRRTFTVDIPLSSPRNSLGLLASYRLGGGWESSLFVQKSDAQRWLSEGDDTAAFTRVDARVARRWTWQGRQVEAALVGQNLGPDYREFRDTNLFSRRVYGSLSFAW